MPHCGHRRDGTGNGEVGWVCDGPVLGRSCLNQTFGSWLEFAASGRAALFAQGFRSLFGSSVLLCAAELGFLPLPGFRPLVFRGVPAFVRPPSTRTKRREGGGSWLSGPS